MTFESSPKKEKMATMKAVRIHQHGGPDAMEVEEIERPAPAPDEILVKVYASGVNPVDATVRSGINEGLNAMLPLPMTPGWDMAGTVEEIGSDVTGFSKGDAVYGVPNFPGNGGSYAEYCAAKAAQCSLKPSSLSFNEAAGVSLAALTAWTGMFAHGRLEAGQRILIQGASGSVGSFAVQFAKAKGAYVIGTASTKNLDYVKSLGADEVIDYTTQKFEDVVRGVDLVLEASIVRDNSERIKSVSVLKEGGAFVSVNTDFPFNDEVLKTFAGKGIQAEQSPNQPRRDWLQEIAALIDAGKVQMLVNKVLPLERAADAHREVEKPTARGKVILEVRKEEGRPQHEAL